MDVKDLETLRRHLQQQRGPQFWRSLNELARTPAFEAYLRQEFPPVAQVWSQPDIDRRTLLKLMGASLALAGLSGCSRPSHEPIVPYVEMPEYEVPGLPQRYASTLTLNGYGRGVLATCYSGRPTKLEGNPDHPASLGASDVFMQAAILQLYDPDRSAIIRFQGRPAAASDLQHALLSLRTQLSAGRGRGSHLLTGQLTSPTELALLTRLRERYPELRHYCHEPTVSPYPRQGAELALGTVAQVIAHYDQAEVIVSLDADFLGASPAQLRHAHDFVRARRPRDMQTRLNRLYVVESSPSLTGASADHRWPLAPAQIAILAHAMAAKLGVALPAGPQPALPEGALDVLIADLNAHAGRCLIVAGDYQPPAVHALVWAMNIRLGNLGNMLHAIAPIAPAAPGLAELTEAMAAGEVDSLIMLGTNPVYSAPAELHFAALLQRVRLRVHAGLYADETAWFSDWHVPLAHELESWGDARAYEGSASLRQPLIEPLNQGRTTLELLAHLAGEVQTDPRELLRSHWQGEHPQEFERFWFDSLQRGVIENSQAAPITVNLQSDLGSHLPTPMPADAALMLQLRPDASTWDGSYANNGWLQELPRPLTKLTWDNAVLISPRDAGRLQLSQGDRVVLRRGRQQLRAPVWIMPGQAAGVMTLSLGYGRTRAGRIGNAVGVDAYALQAAASPWLVAIELRKDQGQAELATTQEHHSMENRHLWRGATLATYQANAHFAKRPEDDPEESLYPEPTPPLPRGPIDHTGGLSPYAWGMAIDLGACIGCNACVIACQAENNIPIVGKKEVSRGREMHWLRIDRYYVGKLDDPAIRFQPVLCMHCENAPCEYVCPVEATQHSSEGLNEMIYNRCIGTRYCSQNCPYKVRRFNWFDFTRPQAKLSTPAPAQNPEVTVRARGVMEKCTYCVQRISAARINADNENRLIRDGEVVTACQMACPTQAIVFGDINQPDSEVAQLKAHPLNYGMLSELNTRPRTTYLAAVHNPNPRLQEPE